MVRLIFGSVGPTLSSLAGVFDVSTEVDKSPLIDRCGFIWTGSVSSGESDRRKESSNGDISRCTSTPFNVTGAAAATTFRSAA